MIQASYLQKKNGAGIMALIAELSMVTIYWNEQRFTKAFCEKLEVFGEG